MATACPESGDRPAQGMVVRAECGQGQASSAEAGVELLRSVRLARLRAESAALGLKSTMSRSPFEGGFEAPERYDDACSPCLIGRGPASALDVYVSEPRDIQARFRCRAESLPPGARRTVRVTWNGTPVGAMDLGAAFEERTFAVDRSLVRRGSNDVSVALGGPVVEPEQRPGSEIPRPAMLACSGIAWSGLKNRPQPTASGSRSLDLPAGSSADFWVELPANGRLDLTVAGDGKASLLAEIETAPRGIREIRAEIPAAKDGKTCSLGIPLDGIEGAARVSLFAVGEAGSLEIRSARLPGAADPRTRRKAAAARSVPPSSPNIFIYLVDTLRRDRLHAFGYARPTSPRLDAFAREAVLFDHAVAQAGWTIPAVASLFTGLEPLQHGANQASPVVPDEADTLPEILTEAGYQTMAFFGSEAVTRQSGFSQGFATYQELPRVAGSGPGPESGVVTAAFEQWLARYEPGRPLFAYIHTVDPHSPYAPPRAFREQFAPGVLKKSMSIHDLTPECADEASDLYDGEVAANDASFGAFLDLLEGRGLLDDSLIIFIADHGEQFLEHGDWRHKVLHAEVLDVPLVIKMPARMGAKPHTVRDPVSQIDILPTIAEIVGVRVPRKAWGRSLVPDLLGRAREEGAGTRHYAYIDKYHRKEWSLVDYPWKLIWRWYRTHREVFLYDTAKDPDEARNLAPVDAVRRDYMKSVLSQNRVHMKPLFEPQPEALTEELQKKLEALGYAR